MDLPPTDLTSSFHGRERQRDPAVTDASGVVQERYSYDAYGHVTVYNANWSYNRNDLGGWQHGPFRRDGS